MPRRPIADRFWEKVNKAGPNGCWVWMGANNRHRPIIWSGGIRGRAIYCHRLVFELIGQGPVPEDMFVDHKCRNGMCVNPDHLRIVTPTVNSTENNESPFARNWAKTHCHRGHPFSGGNLALFPHPKMKRPTRVCLTCWPQYWRFAVVPRDPPPGAHKHPRKRKNEFSTNCSRSE